MISVHPARRRTFLRGVVPVGLGDGVGDFHDARPMVSKEKCLFISLLGLFQGREIYSLFTEEYGLLCCCILLSMLVAKREPTPWLPVMHILSGYALCEHHGGNTGRKNVQDHDFLPWYRRVFPLVNTTDQ